MAQFEVTNPPNGEFSQRERLRAGTAGTERADPEETGNAGAWIPLFHPFIQSKAPYSGEAAPPTFRMSLTSQPALSENTSWTCPEPYPR